MKSFEKILDGYMPTQTLLINNNTKLFAKDMDGTAIEQINKLSKENKNNKIRIMPDYHAGKGCTIGTTLEITDKVNPFHVGVDIGCSVSVYNLGQIDLNLSELDDKIKEAIPTGFEVNKSYTGERYIELEELCYKVGMDIKRMYYSIGTLGGGNHYIEIGKANNESFLSIHTGSRNLGVKVANHYGGDYITGETMKEYLQDMKLTCKYAKINHSVILETILDLIGVEFNTDKWIYTTHNYIEDNMLRKGAISAQIGEIVAIPMNMRDGILICKGKGNKDWNYSAPHGAGRLYSRGKAKKELKMKTFKKQMKGIYSTCITEKTIDESPMVYKKMEDIISLIGDTVEVLYIIKPIYNCKGA